MLISERYANDTRALLDMAAFHIRRLDLPPGAPIVCLGPTELCEDLSYRTGHDHPLVVSGPAPLWVYLWTLEEGAPWPPIEAEHVLVGFRNRMSHRGILHHRNKGFFFLTLERALARDWRVRASLGFMGPMHAARLAAALLADRLGRFDYGFHLRDPVLSGPVERGPARYLSALGLIVGSRR